jgi:hypothetical protein
MWLQNKSIRRCLMINSGKIRGNKSNVIIGVLNEQRDLVSYRCCYYRPSKLGGRAYADF